MCLACSLHTLKVKYKWIDKKKILHTLSWTIATALYNEVHQTVHAAIHFVCCCLFTIYNKSTNGQKQLKC